MLCIKLTGCNIASTTKKQKGDMDMMKKALFVVVVVTLTMLTGCGSNSTETSANMDTSEVLAEIASMKEELKGDIERLEEKVDAIQTVTSTPSEAVPTESETVPKEEAKPAETETVSKDLQLYAIHNGNFIPVKLIEGKLSASCVSNPTDLQSENGTHRDLDFLFLGDKVSEVYWVNGNTFECMHGLIPKASDNSLSYLYFNMEKGDGIYSFEVTTDDGNVYSFSIKYHSDNVF